MTIIEALKSGKRIKLPDWDEWSDTSDLSAQFHLDIYTLMRTDWLIEEPEVKVTRSRLSKAWDKEISSVKCGVYPSHVSTDFTRFCKELGLDE